MELTDGTTRGYLKTELEDYKEQRDKAHRRFQEASDKLLELGMPILSTIQLDDEGNVVEAENPVVGTS